MMTLVMIDVVVPTGSSIRKKLEPEGGTREGMESKDQRGPNDGRDTWGYHIGK